MSRLAKWLRPSPDPREAIRPLWHRVVEIAREKEWYRDCGVADTVAGRFDAITLILSLVLIRMEREDTMADASVRLTELFVDDMDGQLRQGGVGDLIVGKHIGTLMSTLGGRLGAYRTALDEGEASTTAAVARNVTMREGGDPLLVAQRARAFAAGLAATPAMRLLTAEIGR
ncbi:ubiquinol-cytochrome C chaperone family protein [Novosphingobium acidiphilum]|jgi:cytochrome b pre-mRNA-processing protein 3|uniref:ubiquinol-cytochrome C chaperone family protein n=1 Tax=Novosphingobium acidiphilum TaxID=505248 RepID=UPI00042563E4|nr:ubiquinol-cytochrome C chaperone family protein [Novosphingobium acidiphilum]